MSGIIDTPGLVTPNPNVIQTPGVATPSIASSSYTAPVARTVDPAQETVAGQMKGLIQDNSPLIQMARTGANQQMNQRGLLNSSLAITAGDQAAYQAALPIAQADANVYGNAANLNNTTTNQSLAARDQAQTATSVANTAQTNDIAKANLSADTQKNIATTEANYKTGQQLQGSAAGLQSNYATQRTQIMQNTTMDAASKSAALNALNAQYKSDLNLLGSVAGIDLTSVLNGV